MARILIIDDNEPTREDMAVTVRRMGHDTMLAGSGADGLALLRRQGADLVITDLKMEGDGGMEVMEDVKRIDPACPTLIVTAIDSVETAVQAMRLGAMDFLQKPFAPEILSLKVERALEMRREKVARQRAEAEVKILRADTAAPFGLGDMVGQSPPMRVLLELIEKVAPTDVAVHIAGESGTGKELVARAIHHRSRRASGPFVKVNCGALTEPLLERADGGTLFLNEVSDMSPDLQLKLLRVLQEKEFERVDGEEAVRVDVRVVSSAHRDLKKEVEAGRFREDLFYRLHVVPCLVAPLRDRREDIPLLVEHFIRKLAPRANPTIKGIDETAMARLSTYQWPGNIRELKNAVEQALVFASGDSIGVAALPSFLRETVSESTLAVPSGNMTLPEILEDLERQLIQKTYDKTGGVKTETARLLGIKTSALYYKLEKYGIGGIAGQPAGSPPPEGKDSGS